MRAEVRDALQDIVDENNRAGAVILRLRGLLKKGERTAETVDVNGLVNSTLALLNSELISRGSRVKVEQALELPTTYGDPIQLQQVLLNLAMNAMSNATLRAKRATTPGRRSPARSRPLGFQLAIIARAVIVIGRISVIARRTVIPWVSTR